MVKTVKLKAKNCRKYFMLFLICCASQNIKKSVSPMIVWVNDKQVHRGASLLKCKLFFITEIAPAAILIYFSTFVRLKVIYFLFVWCLCLYNLLILQKETFHLSFYLNFFLHILGSESRPRLAEQQKILFWKKEQTYNFKFFCKYSVTSFCIFLFFYLFFL